MIPRTQTELLQHQIASEKEIKDCAFRDGFFRGVNIVLVSSVFILIVSFIVLTIARQNQERQVYHEQHTTRA